MIKTTKTLLIAIVVLFTINNSIAQNDSKPWIIGIGANAVDYYPSPEGSLNPMPTNNTSGFGADYFNVGDHWNNAIISKIQIGRYLGHGFTFEFSPSINKITKVGDYTIPSRSYLALDGNIKYAIKNLFKKDESTFFQPYLYFGGGYTWLEDIGAGTANMGIGSNFWFSKKMGAAIQTGYKTDVEDYFNSHFQHSLTLIYRFGHSKEEKLEEEKAKEAIANQKIDTDMDGVPDVQEKIDGTDAYNNCSLVINSQSLKPNEIWKNKDCDGDGVINNTEKTDITGIQDPCDYNKASITVAKSIVWNKIDCDGDGIPNGIEIAKGTDPNDKESYPTDSKRTDPETRDPKTTTSGNNDSTNDVDDELYITFEKTIYFKTDFDNPFGLKTWPTAALNEVKAFALKYPNSTFEIEGYTDSRNSNDYNMKLSKRRANNVKKWLIIHGIEESRLSTVAYGETKPVAPNNSAENMAKNRRVVVRMTGRILK